MKTVVAVILIALPALGPAQCDYYRFPSVEEEKTWPGRITVLWANDIFFQTDRYYTNGLRISYSNQNLKLLPLTGLLFNPLVETPAFYSVTLTHHIYTPRNTLGKPLAGDRPYAGYLLVGLRSVRYGENGLFSLTTELQAGMLGKYSGGELVQNSIHVLLPDSEPLPGWAYQINNDICADYVIEYAQQVTAAGRFKTDLLAGSRLGVPFTDFSGGMRIRWSNSDHFFSPEHLLQPEAFVLTFFAESTLSLVMYDGTLQGGIIGSSLNTLRSINSFVLNFDMGVNIKWHHLLLDAGARMNSPRFPDALPHRWGYLRIGKLF